MKTLPSLLLTLAVLAIALIPAFPTPTASAAAPAIGELAPDFTFSDFDGKAHRLSDFRGKPVLLDFWATWCGPCIAELPTLRAVHAEMKDEGFVVFSLSVDDNMATAKAYTAKNDMPWTQGWAPGAWRNEAVKKFGVDGIPSVWLIGADGKIKATNLRGEETKAAARLLLEEKLQITSQPDVRVQGKIVDEDGKPIAGAKITFRGFRKGDVAKGITQKSLGESTFTTDASGVWTCEKMVAVATQIYFAAHHPDYDSGAGRLKFQKCESLSDFYAGNLETVLPRGERLSGIVKDTQGKLLAGIPVSLGQSSNLPPQKTNEKGEFYFTIAKDTPVIYLSSKQKGYVTKYAKFRLGKCPWPVVELTLEPGKKMKGIVVDASGNPLPGAYVYVRESYFPYQVSVTDKAGHFRFENMPESPISLEINLESFAKIGDFKAEVGKENKVVLPKMNSVHGTVVDAETGEAIKNYKVYRYTFRPGTDIGHYEWQRIEKENQSRVYGYTELLLNKDGSFNNALPFPTMHYYYRVMADAYYPAVSPKIRFEDKKLDFVFRLERGKTTELKIVDSQGKPVSEALVTHGVLWEIKSYAEAGNVGVSWVLDEYGKRKTWMAYPHLYYINGELKKAMIVEFDKLRTNADGILLVPPTKEKYRLTISHPSGWAKVFSRALQADKPIVLTPWGKIRGKSFIGDKPNVGTTVNYEQWESSQIRHQSKAIVDKDGNFELDCLLPGTVRIRDMNGKREHKVTVESGKTTEIELGKEGRPVIGKFILPKTTHYASIEIRQGGSERLVLADGYEWEEERTEEENELEKESASLKREEEGWKRSVLADANNDVVFRFEAVPPGKYYLFCDLGRIVRHFEVTVPEGKRYSAEPLDL